ncbi:AAA family ATPase [Zymomonas mobilis]|uniref:Anticodon nuclease PrrC n=1 Tax=Zymomonas mobilis subsp. pomaceae (strain ATCC 29192 / DSM 22645 / JCM 10191 / CCUG 17912 / NBRC 13757 / NCIMB 11200 / NRRL B-4491 / Barker I) TaxID=579138 RepID=F8EWI4_ZYMMT|nr:AAA family ATPase [Zymomonas mobilis]AEI38627.1 anticodon nuclease PrrC [Zymomonas mobilis subsp. pomaceae ATCC 29192]MDX5947815.1 AAA family ATPase [Zymomonas mobilis subsp. pomaceae]GEB90095.1 anticodon nuclease [Zymomonas mobilis subsp. pomaceae]
MGQTLTEIAETLRDADKKVQLIYAFNASGKTRLSRAFKNLIAPKSQDNDETLDEAILPREKILYYNAFTEDLFYWDNDLLSDGEPKLIIQPNTFTDWIIGEQGKDNDVIANFQHYTNKNLTPVFLEKDGPRVGEKTYPSVSFSLATGDDEATTGIKISKGEESNFIWSVFFTLIEEVVTVLSAAEAEDRSTNKFDKLEYVFIDDPVSSLDDNHLIELAQTLATLIKSAPQDGPKFIITTHNPLFFNVLFNAFKKGLKYQLSQNEDGTFSLDRWNTDSPFSYHLHLIEKLKTASENDGFEKYHYNLLRNILEKTATFMGYEDWADLLPHTADGTSDAYLKRVVDISSHSKHAGDEQPQLSKDDKRVLGYLLGETANKKYEFAARYRMIVEETPDD